MSNVLQVKARICDPGEQFVSTLINEGACNPSGMQDRPEVEIALRIARSSDNNVLNGNAYTVTGALHPNKEHPLDQILLLERCLRQSNLMEDEMFGTNAALLYYTAGEIAERALVYVPITNESLRAAQDKAVDPEGLYVLGANIVRLSPGTACA